MERGNLSSANPDANLTARFHRVAVGSAPWHVVVHYRGQQDMSRPEDVCAGALISDDLVVTAAHCINQLQIQRRGFDVTRDVMIRLGKHNRLETEAFEVNRTISEYIPHPDFNQWTYSYDIAVIRLSRRVIFTNHIAPLCLPPSSTADVISAPDDRAVVTGWGLMPEPDTGSDRLKAVAVPLKSRPVCQSSMIQPVPASVLGAGQGNGGSIDVCLGDDGGPLVVERAGQWYLVGLGSFGQVECTHQGKYAFYTNITQPSIISWIQYQRAE